MTFEVVVRLKSSGAEVGRATAEGFEAAVQTARQLRRDDYERWPLQGRKYLAQFWTGGECVMVREVV